MPPTKHSCTLAVTKNLSDKDAENLCEYFASRLKPIHVEYSGRKGALHIKWSPNRFVTTFKTLKKCLENVRPITEDSEDVDAVAYAFHSKYVGADTSVDRPHNKPKYPSHVLLELPNGQIFVIPGASGVHTSPDTIDQDDYEPIDSKSTYIAGPSSNPFENPEPAFKINVQGAPDPSEAASDLNDLMDDLIPGAGVTLGDGGLAELRVPDNSTIERRSWGQLAELSGQDDVCGIFTAVSRTGDSYAEGNDTVFVAPWDITNTLQIYDEVGHWIGTEKDDGRLVLLSRYHLTGPTRATGSGIVRARRGPDGEYIVASLRSFEWPERWNGKDDCT